MGAAGIAHQQGITLRIVAGVVCVPGYLDQAAVGILRLPRGDALGDDGAAGVPAEMDHLGAGIGLLVIVRHRDGIELAAGIVAAQDAARVFPGNRRAGLDLGPGNPGTVAAAIAALGHEVIDAADAVFIAGVPVLYRRVLDLRVIKRNQFHHCRMQLVFITHGRCTSFQVAHVAAFLCHDEGSFKLPGIGRVDAEVSRQFHWATSVFRDKAERTVGKHC